MNQSVFLILFVIGCCLDVVADVFFMNQLMGSRAVYYLGSGLTIIGGVGTAWQPRDDSIAISSLRDELPLLAILPRQRPRCAVV